MKKVFALLFVAGVLAFAACTKKEETTTVVETPAVDTAMVAMDSTMAPMDSTMVPADSAK
ncbi:MAG: hypothetical protein ACKVOU_09865 [Cytophagales bacterium]